MFVHASVTEWLPGISMGLFTLSDDKHQKNQSQRQTQMFSVNGPLISHFCLVHHFLLGTLH